MFSITESLTNKWLVVFGLILMTSLASSDTCIYGNYETPYYVETAGRFDFENSSGWLSANLKELDYACQLCLTGAGCSNIACDVVYNRTRQMNANFNTDNPGETSKIKFIIHLEPNYTKSHTNGTGSVLGGAMNDIKEADWTSRDYAIVFRKENTNEVVDWSKYAAGTLNVYCDDYTMQSFDLKTDNITTVHIGTRQPPTFILNVNDTHYRVRAKPTAPSNLEMFTIFSEPTKITFQMVDFTNQFGDNALLYVEKYIDNNTLSVINVNKFNTERKQDVYLMNATYYKLRVVDGVNERDAGLQYIIDTGVVKVIEINKPSVGDVSNKFAGLSFDFLSSYDLSSLIFNYTHTGGNITLAQLYIYNINSSDQMVQIFNYNTTNTTSGYMVYNVSNRSMSYIMKAILRHSSYGDMTFSRNAQFDNSSVRKISLINTTALNVSPAAIHRAIALLILCGLAFAFTPYFQGIGSVIILAAIVFLNWLNWITVPNIIFAMLCIIVLINAYVHRRVKI